MKDCLWNAKKVGMKLASILSRRCNFKEKRRNSMIQSLATEEEIKLFKKTVEAFAKKEIESHYPQWEETATIPRELWKKLGGNGLLCVDIPEQYGGLGAPLTFAYIIIEEFSRLGYHSIAVNLSVHSNIVAHYILNAGTEEQKNYYLPKMVSGELIGAIAMTEPNAGSDLQGVKTMAIKDESINQYVINGSKTFITNGQSFDFVIVVAKTNPEVAPSKGMSLFIVDADCEGVIKGKKLKKIGLRSSDTSELFLEDVKVSSENLLGELNGGFFVLMNELPRERTTLAAAAVAAMEGAIELTVNYVQEREAFGNSLSKLQVIRHKIAEMMTEARLNRAFVNECVRLLEEGNLTTAEASMVKLAATEAQCKVMDRCLQLFGGYGYMEEYPISRFFTDARIQRIYGGTSEIMKEIISKDILGR